MISMVVGNSAGSINRNYEMNMNITRFSIYVTPEERQQMIDQNAKRGLECIKTTFLSEKKICLTFDRVVKGK